MQDFFPNIAADRVRQMFSDLGFNTRLAAMLTRLTTAEGHLQQGFATSPAIANLLARPFDDEVSSWCHLHGLRYTRYVDDITISGPSAAMGTVDAVVRDAMHRHGFIYSESKHRLMDHQSPQIVTGLAVNSGLDPSPDYMSDITAQIEDFGSTAATLSLVVLKADYVSLCGRVEFCRQVNKETGAAVAAHLHSVVVGLPPRQQLALLPRPKAHRPPRRGRRRHVFTPTV